MRNSILQRFNLSAALPVLLALYLLFSMISISIGQIFLGLFLVCWLILLAAKKIKFEMPVFFWFLIAYSFLTLLSCIFSVDPALSFKDSKELFLFLIIPMVYTGFKNTTVLKRTCYAFFASGIAASVYGIYQFFFELQYWQRSSGFMSQPMTQAGLLILFIAMSLSFFVFSQDKQRFLWGLALPFGLTALTLTQIRSSWIGLIGAAVLILFLYKPKTLIFVPLALALLFIFSSQIIKDRVLSVFDLKSEAHVERWSFVRTGLHIVKEYPLLGTGPDTVDIVFQDPEYGLSDEAKKNVHLHNNIIQIAAERGILTLAVWLSLIVWLFISLIKKLKNKDPVLFPITVGALAVLTAFFIAGQFEYNFGDSEIATLFLFIITLPFAVERIQKNQGEAPN
jgi:O-antigen ligase